MVYVCVTEFFINVFLWDLHCKYLIVYRRVYNTNSGSYGSSCVYSTCTTATLDCMRVGLVAVSAVHGLHLQDHAPTNLCAI